MGFLFSNRKIKEGFDPEKNQTMITQNLFAIFILILLGYNANAQSLTESGILFDKIEMIINNMPGANGDDYIEPSAVQLTTWNQLIENLLQLNLSSTTNLANQLDYDLIEFTKTSNNQQYYILQSRAINGNFWGTYVFNPTSCQTNLVIESPHPIIDWNTGKQGIYIFENVGASFYMVAGTHRCNSLTSSSCSGTTSVCSASSQDYRITAFIIQLHGFAWDPDGELPNLIMSNTISTPPIGVDYIDSLGMEIINIDPSLTYGVEHITPSLPLSGSTNTQGRYCNESPNPCSYSGTFNSGRFFHLEQSLPQLRATSTDWQKLASALDNFMRNLEIEEELSTGYYKAKDILTSHSQIALNNNVTLIAGECINLEPNFEVILGSRLTVEIDSCQTP